jgi:predicted kinase
MLARYDRAVQSMPPALVIVSGAPGSGKSTLARRLSVDLRLPLLAKDPFKEALADAIGPPVDVAASSRLGEGAYAVLYLAARELLAAGRGLILESNFRRARSEADLEPLLRLGHSCLIHCTTDEDALIARYAQRFARGERHPAHLDGDRLGVLREDLVAGRFEPLRLPIPTLVVDTSAGWTPDYADVRDFAAAPPVAARR